MIRITHAEKRIIRIVALVFVVMAIGAIFYHLMEGWDWLDSFYFATITLTTIGFGDLHPTHDLSKVFTMFYAVGGISLMLYSLNAVAQYYVEKRYPKVIGQAIEFGRPVHKAVPGHRALKAFKLARKESEVGGQQLEQKPQEPKTGF